MKYFISIITGALNGLMIWALIGWFFQKKIPAGKKYFIFFIVILVLSIASDILAWIIIHK